MVDWDKAPKKAKYAAQDKDGAWWFYMDKPLLGKKLWISSSVPVFAGKTEPTKEWHSTLQPRPKRGKARAK